MKKKPLAYVWENPNFSWNASANLHLVQLEKNDKNTFQNIKEVIHMILCGPNSTRDSAWDQYFCYPNIIYIISSISVYSQISSTISYILITIRFNWERKERKELLILWIWNQATFYKTMEMNICSFFSDERVSIN